MIDEMLSQLSRWLRGDGTDSEIVISCRIRLARNLSGYPFITRATETDRRGIRDSVRRVADKLWGESGFYFVDVDILSPLDRMFLLERQLISRELIGSTGTRAALIDKSESFCVMINEEDHLRIQAMTSGFEPEKIWELVNDIDDKFSASLPYSFHRQFGYLSTCPTNVGTGMRVSVMLHLPALSVTKEIEKVLRGLQKVHLTVRGLYGENSHPVGDLYQISNQTTLGKTELELIGTLRNFIPQVLEFERRSRDFLLHSQRDMILDRCSRAVGLLKTARTIGGVETLHHLSSLRLGVNMGLIDNITIEEVNRLFLESQAAHLQKITGQKLPTQIERDVARAKFLRTKLGTL
ncbi:MAG: protein arginine kinase [Planctomycetaceae bacterium]|jgi:protein arginine kinase|nr:protein arginine kinase [Planctomycetaceae bacterium]